MRRAGPPPSSEDARAAAPAACLTRSLSPRVPPPRSALATRVRFWATELVTLANETRAAQAPLMQKNVNWAVGNATLNYYAAVYGVPSEGTEQALTADQSLDDLLFGEGFCLAASASGCYSAKQPWYTATAFGLDDALHAWAEEALFLALEAPAAATTANDHFMFVWEVGRGALSGGLQQLLDLSNALAQADVETALTIQIVLLCGSAVVNVVYFVLAFSPWLKRTLKEPTRAAELLSVLPKEVDVVGLIVKNFEAAHERVRRPQRRRHDGLSSPSRRAAALPSAPPRAALTALCSSSSQERGGKGSLMSEDSSAGLGTATAAKPSSTALMKGRVM